MDNKQTPSVAEKPTELLPCPFCGSRHPEYTKVTPEIAKAWGYTSRDANWCVACPKCGISTPFKLTQQMAAEFWNIRESKKLSREFHELYAATYDALAQVKEKP